MVFDLDKVKKSEAGVPFEFTTQGQRFSFPHAEAVDWHVSKHIAEGDLVEAVKVLLGPADFRRFDKLKLTMGDLNDLFEEYTASMGTSMGESQASTDS